MAVEGQSFFILPDRIYCVHRNDIIKIQLKSPEPGCHPESIWLAGALCFEYSLSFMEGKAPYSLFKLLLKGDAAMHILPDRFTLAPTHLFPGFVSQ
jgi:hypothetical protein